jgi:hypothetical protein
MSSKFKVLSIALVALLALGFYSATTKADVTGSFGLHLSFNPIACMDVPIYVSQTESVQLGDQPCEKTVFKIDFQTDLDINIAISGLTMGLHSHAGVTGIEDIILSFAATLGALDIEDTFVFAQPFGTIVAGDGQLIPACYENEEGGECDILFVKKRVEMSISLGGVTFSNLAILEDVTFPECYAYEPYGCINLDTLVILIKPEGATYTVADQHFGFGDVITIEGQTPSGITIKGETGICAQQLTNQIKKHLWSFTVNPDCVEGAQTPSLKPPLFFDFEKIWITGIPLTTDLTADLHVACEQPSIACEFELDLTFTGSPLFPVITAELGFANIVGPFEFVEASLVLPAGPLTLTFTFDAVLEITEIEADISFTLNPDTNPATVDVEVVAEPPDGITSVEVDFTVVRSGLVLIAAADFSGTAGEFTFDDLTLTVQAEAGVITASASVLVTPTGLVGGDLTASVSF